MSPDVASVIARALSLTATLQAAGIAIFLASVGGYLGESRRFILRAAQLFVVLSAPRLLTQYAIEAARMADAWPGIFDARFQQMAMTSGGGVVLGVRLAGLAAIALGLRPSASRRRRVTSIAVGAVILAASFALTGHTVVHPLRPLLAPLLIAHVLIVTFWLGALLPLYVACRHETSVQAGQAVVAFSASATWLVPCIAIAGALMILGVVQDVGIYWERYGELLLTKIGGFATLMSLAALNRWRLGPAISTGGPPSMRAFRRALVVSVWSRLPLAGC